MDVHNQNQIMNQRISDLHTEFLLIDHGLCPDWSMGTHRCRRDTMYLILDGQGKITINGETIYPKKNNMVLMPKNSMVSFHSENETCYNKYWCEFIMQLNGISLFEVIDFPYMIKLDDISRALELFERLDELHLKTDVCSAFLQKSVLLELVSMFLEYDTKEARNKVRNDPFTDKVKAFIDAHISENISVKTIADKMGYSEKYFIKVFKAHFGVTPAQYIKAARLALAKRELLYSNNKIFYIANKLGYSSAEKLAKDFRAYTGFSPSEFRKKFK